MLWAVFFSRIYLFSLGQTNSCHSIPVYLVRTCVSSDAEIFHYLGVRRSGLMGLYHRDFARVWSKFCLNYD